MDRIPEKLVLGVREGAVVATALYTDGSSEDVTNETDFVVHPHPRTKERCYIGGVYAEGPITASGSCEVATGDLDSDRVKVPAR